MVTIESDAALTTSDAEQVIRAAMSTPLGRSACVEAYRLGYGKSHYWPEDLPFLPPDPCDRQALLTWRYSFAGRILRCWHWVAARLAQSA